MLACPQQNSKFVFTKRSCLALFAPANAWLLWVVVLALRNALTTFCEATVPSPRTGKVTQNAFGIDPGWYSKCLKPLNGGPKLAQDA